MTWRDLIVFTITYTLFFLGVTAGWAWVERINAPRAVTVYCSTGAGPVVIDGFDWRTGPNPLYSEVLELTFKETPDARFRQVVAMQPPFECSQI